MGATFKLVYGGQGIYWHHAARLYGDETVPRWKTMSDARAAIDANNAARDAARPECEKWWDTLSSAERENIRRAYNASSEAWDRYDSVAQFGFDNR